MCLLIFLANVQMGGKQTQPQAIDNSSMAHHSGRQQPLFYLSGETHVLQCTSALLLIRIKLFVLVRQTTPVPLVHQSTTPVPLVHQSTTPVPLVHQTTTLVPLVHQSTTPVPLVHQSTTLVPLVHQSTTPVPLVHQSTTPVPLVHLYLWSISQLHLYLWSIRQLHLYLCMHNSQSKTTLVLTNEAGNWRVMRYTGQSHEWNRCRNKRGWTTSEHFCTL